MSAASLPSTASADLSTRLAALSAKATPGPWAVDPEHVVVAHDPQSPDRPWYVAEMVAEAGSGTISDNAAFIVAAVNAVRSGALVPAPTEAARGLAVTEEMVLVPVEASLAMQNAGWRQYEDEQGLDASEVEMAPLWSAMLKAAALRTSPPETVGGRALPSQEQMNQAFYVDVCRAEDRLKKFIATARTLLAALPDHWHDDATVNLMDLCDETDAILNPHMHTPYQVGQAQKSYGADRVVPAALSSAPPAEETWQATHRHVKRGFEYVLLGEAEGQIATTRIVGEKPGTAFVREGDKIAVYQAKNGKLWWRFPDEFHDGRFTPLPPAPAREAK